MWKWGCRDIRVYMWGRRGYLGGVGLQSPDSKQGSRNIWGGRGGLTKCHALSIQFYHKKSDIFTLTHGKINISHNCCGMWILDFDSDRRCQLRFLSPWGAVARRALLDDNINNFCPRRRLQTLCTWISLGFLQVHWIIQEFCCDPPSKFMEK